MSHPLCQHCRNRFYGRQNRIACVNCKLSVHTRCAGIKTDEGYQLLLDSFWCNICKAKCASSTSSRNNNMSNSDSIDMGVSDDDILPIMIEKLDLVISEVKGLRQQVTHLSAENSILKGLVEKLSKSGNPAPVTGNKASTPRFSEVVKQPVSTLSHTISNNNQTHLSKPQIQTRNFTDGQVQQSAARGSKMHAAESREEVSQNDGFTEYWGRKRKRNASTSNGKGSQAPAARYQNNSNPSAHASYVNRAAPLIGVKTSSSLKCVDPKKLVRYKALFVTRLAPETTADEIEAHLKADLPILNDVKVSKLATRLTNYASFHIKVPLSDFPLVNNTTIWPEGALVKEFRGRMTPDKCFGYKPPLSSNSADNNLTLSVDNATSTVIRNNGIPNSNTPATST